MSTLLTETQPLVDGALAQVLEHIGIPRATDGPDGAHAVPARLLEAMRYAVLAPGKRLRPALVLGSAAAVGARPEEVLAPACAVEMMHAYSLVHDDLPALDDDELRRGRPTVHRAFDEATAILTGDALLTEALALLADGLPSFKFRARPRDRARAVAELARAAGAGGMVGGQQDDIALGADGSPERLRSIHRRKTGRLIQTSAALGAIWMGAPEFEVEVLRKFGADLGLAFQLVDDAIDNDGVARVIGREQARREARSLTEAALAELSPFGRHARPLEGLARMMLEREA